MKNSSLSFFANCCYYFKGKQGNSKAVNIKNGVALMPQLRKIRIDVPKVQQPSYQLPESFVREVEKAGIVLEQKTYTPQEQLKKEEVLLVTGKPQTIEDAIKKAIPVLAVETEGDRLYGTRYVLEGMQGLELDFCEKVFARAHHMPWKIAQTKRCEIRELALSDLDALYEMYAQPGMTDYMSPLHEDYEEEVEYQRAYIEHMYGLYGYGMWLVFEKESGRLIGRAGLEHRTVGSEECLELGYAIAPAFQRQGYATEVCRCLLELAAEIAPGELLHAFVEPENHASICFLAKMGFHRLEKVKIDKKFMERYVKTLH
jgi:RimJ/RimL family protein N-acetyltransferase